MQRVRDMVQHPLCLAARQRQGLALIGVFQPRM
jgi:hypothetical protein